MSDTEVTIIRARGKTYRVVNGVRYREIEGYIRSEVVAELRELREALKTVITGAQSYRVGTRTLTRADPAALRAREQYLLGLLAQFDNDSTGARIQYAVPTDR